MTVKLWHGAAQDPLFGHCGNNDDGWCGFEGKDQARQARPVDGDMIRVEVKFGDMDPRGYSEQRALMTAVNQTTYKEGDETWMYWETEYPLDFMLMYPKQDELPSWPRVYLSPGSCVEWHHAPSESGKYKGDWSKMPQGSAPIYTGVNAGGHYLSLVKSITESVEYKGFHSPLILGQRNRHLMHVRWSADPNLGFLEYWVNDLKLAGDANGPLRVFTLFPDTDTYLVAGIYRRETIGDPSLVWPADQQEEVHYPYGFVPHKGLRVYTKDDGYPSSMQLGKAYVGPTRDSVLQPAVATPPTATPPVVSQPPVDTQPQTPPTVINDPLKAEQWRLFLVDELQAFFKKQADTLQAASTALNTAVQNAIVAVNGALADVKKTSDDLTQILNKGR